MKVIEDFLSKEQFDLIQSAFMGPYFPWYYNSNVNPAVYGDDDPSLFRYQFTHRIFWDQEIGGTGKDDSPFFRIIEPCLQRLGVQRLIRLKANLTPRTVFHREMSGYHIDVSLPGKTSILYINTNNGYTQFKNGDKVKSVANRMVTFDSQKLHSGISCTNQKMRVVLNFNYDI